LIFQLDKAKDYALRQLQIACETHNERLQVRALLYYSLYLISIRKYRTARKLIEIQKAKAQELEDDHVSFQSIFVS
jgi:hypothetical protein